MPCRAGTGRYWRYCCGSSQPRAGAAHPPSGAAALRRIGHGRAAGSSGLPCTGGAPRSDWAAHQAPRRRCGPRRHAARSIACRPRRFRPGPGPGPGWCWRYRSFARAAGPCRGPGRAQPACRAARPRHHRRLPALWRRCHARSRAGSECHNGVRHGQPGLTGPNARALPARGRQAFALRRKAAKTWVRGRVAKKKLPRGDDSSSRKVRLQLPQNGSS